MKIEELQTLVESMRKSHSQKDHPDVVIANALVIIASSLHEINKSLKRPDPSLTGPR